MVEVLEIPVKMSSIEVSQMMNAAQYDPKQSKVVVNKIPIPKPKPNQVLIKIASASLCHSDLMAIGRPDLQEPFTLGHEGAGYVKTIGTAVPKSKIDWREGSPVGFLYINGCCFECEGCMVHNMHCLVGKPVVAGFDEFGFFAEYAVVDWQNVNLLPPQLDAKNSSAIFCAGITAYHAVNSCELRPGQIIAIIGAGGLGQLATQYAKALGLLVIAVDINDETLSVCKRQGADYVFNSLKNKDTYIQEVKKVTPKELGCHAAAVFSASEAAYASTPALLRPGGIWMFIGIANSPIEVSAFHLAIGSYVVKSDSTGTPQRMGPAVEFTAKHGIVPEVDIRKDLNEVQGMIDDMRAGRSTKRMGVVFE